MVTISHIVKKIVNESPMLQEAMAREIVSYGALADYLTKQIETELGKEVKHSAIMMALRRYSEELSKKRTKIDVFDYSSELTMKTNLVDINVVRSSTLLKRINQLYSIVDYEKGDFFNTVESSNEIAIVTNERNLDQIKKFLKNENILRLEKNLISITMLLSKQFLKTPGVISRITSELSWENINIFELITTMTEMTIIIHKKDLARAYNILEDMMENCKK
jgi:aspartokinase